MNFKSGILKLSILIMLVLVLLPAIAAEDSSEAFFIEYADEGEEVIVEESDSIEEVEFAQEDVSDSCEISTIDEKHEDVIDEVHMNQSSEGIEEYNDDILISEQEGSVVETHDAVEEIENEDILYLHHENVNNNVDLDNVNYHDSLNESDDYELTTENWVIDQGSIFISKHVYNDINLILINELYNGTAIETPNGFKRGSFKVLELKNSILINQDIQLLFVDNFISNIDGDIIVCTDKTTNDFIFSIDNSVVGDEDLIISVNISYCLNFNPCFNTFICFKFLDVGCFGGDFS